MPPQEFESAIPASERLQTLTLDSSATGIDFRLVYFNKIYKRIKTLPQNAQAPQPCSAAKETEGNVKGFSYFLRFTTLISKKGSPFLFLTTAKQKYEASNVQLHPHVAYNA